MAWKGSGVRVPFGPPSISVGTTHRQRCLHWKKDEKGSSEASLKDVAERRSIRASVGLSAAQDASPLRSTKYYVQYGLLHLGFLGFGAAIAETAAVHRLTKILEYGKLYGNYDNHLQQYSSLCIVASRTHPRNVGTSFVREENSVLIGREK